MPRNTLGDLNLHLFMQLERLNDENIKGENLREEIERSKAITIVAKQIIDNANTVLEAKKFISETIDADAKLPKMLEG